MYISTIQHLIKLAFLSNPNCMGFRSLKSFKKFTQIKKKKKHPKLRYTVGKIKNKIGVVAKSVL